MSKRKWLIALLAGTSIACLCAADQRQIRRLLEKTAEELTDLDTLPD
jgi:hypothetical protein